MPAPTKVLYIAGSGRSCTTLLGHILGQVPGFCFIGEAMYAWRVIGDRLHILLGALSAILAAVAVGLALFGGSVAIAAVPPTTALALLKTRSA